MPPALGRILDPVQQLLVGERQPLVVAGLEVERRRRGQRLGVVRLDLQHALVDRDRLAIVAQPVADQLAQGHRRRDPLRRILGQEQLPLGDLDHPRPVLVALVDRPQPRVRLGAARVDLADQSLQRLGGGVAVEQLLFEDLRARQRQGDGPCRLLGQRDLTLEDLDQPGPVLLVVADPRQRIERLFVGRQQLGQLFPGLAGPGEVADRPFDQAGQLAQVLGLQRRVRDHPLDLGVEHARQVRIVLERRVDLAQRVERLAVVGIEVDHLLVAGGGGGRILQRRQLNLGDPVQDLDLLVGVRGVLGVLLQHLHQVRRQPGPLEDPLEAGQRVAVAGYGLEDLVRRPLPLGEVAGVLVADHQHPAQQADPLLLRFGPLDLIAQELREADEVPFALVDLDDQPHRHRVVRVVAEDLLVDLDRARRVRQLLAVDLGHPAQDLGPRARIGLRRRLAFEQRRHPVPALALEQQAALRFAGPVVGGGDLLGPLPGDEGALGIRPAASRRWWRSPRGAGGARRRGPRPAGPVRTRTRADRPAPPSPPSRGSARRRRRARPGSRARARAPRAGRRPPDRDRRAVRGRAPPARASAWRAPPGRPPHRAGARVARRASRSPARRGRARPASPRPDRRAARAAKFRCRPAAPPRDRPAHPRRAGPACRGS